jgi:ribose-phosphate pyrophosphokinase
VAIFFPLPGNAKLATDLADLTAGEVGKLELRHFPDGETYLRVLTNVQGGTAFVVCTLARPDPQFVALAFLARQLRECGAERVELIAPYLPYLRQDRIFHRGEALTSRLFAELLQQHFDRLLTVDPHLHRFASLDEIYDVPAVAIHSAPLLAGWVKDHVEEPLIIGPDAESAQWVEAIARQAGAAWTVFNKVRRGDRKIRMHAPSLAGLRDKTPVLVDDILSSGVTMRQAIRCVREQGLKAPSCLVIHSVCSPTTARSIRDNAAAFATSNTVPNPDAAVDVAPLIAAELIAAAAHQVLATGARGRPQARSGGRGSS